MARELVIKKYFNEGFTYDDIVNFLFNYHNFSISRRHLIRILKRLGLKRKNTVEDSLEAICSAVVNEVCAGGSCISYKRM